MAHRIKEFCDKIDSIKKMADMLRKTPPSDTNLRNLVENIQSDCFLVSKGKVNTEFFDNINDYEKYNKSSNFDYSGIDHDSMSKPEK